MGNSHDKAENYSNLELHGWLNLLCYSTDAEKERHPFSSGGWIDQAERESMHRETDAPVR